MIRRRGLRLIWVCIVCNCPLDLNRLTRIVNIISDAGQDVGMFLESMKLESFQKSSRKITSYEGESISNRPIPFPMNRSGACFMNIS